MKRSRVIVATLTLAAVVITAVALSWPVLFPPPPKEPFLAFTHPEYLPTQPCSECHEYDHGVPYAGLPCDDCHDLKSWRNIRYEHTGDGAQMSLGLHAVIGCDRCHDEGALVELDAGCANCHPEAPPHGGPTQCEKCHIAVSWRIVVPPEDHFPLIGGHSALPCFACHREDRPTFETLECTTCHGVAHGGLTDCGACHTVLAFKPSTFLHRHVFVLTGRHAQLECSRCHPNNLFAVSDGTRCTNCHGSAHGGLTECQFCHTTSAFKPSKFRHSSVYPLIGAHAKLRCSACHPRGAFAKVAGTQCADCHGTAHGGLRNCQDCHTPYGFVPSSFRHSSVYPLVGGHARASCDGCHPGNRYAEVRGTRCTNCHGTAHGGRRDCERCHTPSGWTLSTSFRHTSRFPLQGQHATLDCVACHPGLTFGGAPDQCRNCHTAPHVGPTDCARCHNAGGWSNVRFNHVPMAYHDGIGVNGTCANCHPGGNFTVYTCSQCHDDGRSYDPSIDF